MNNPLSGLIILLALFWADVYVGLATTLAATVAISTALVSQITNQNIFVVSSAYLRHLLTVSKKYKIFYGNYRYLDSQTNKLLQELQPIMLYSWARSLLHCGHQCFQNSCIAKFGFSSYWPQHSGNV